MMDTNFHEAKRLAGEQREIGERVAALQSEHAGLAEQYRAMGSALGEARSRARLKAHGETIERQIALLEMDRNDIARRIGELADLRSSLQIERSRLTDEIDRTPDEETRDGLLKQLVYVLNRLGWLEGSQTLVDEAAAIWDEIEERSPTVALTESWVRTPKGELIRERELGEHGAIGVTAYARGQRVLKTEAQKLGLI